MPSVVSGPRFQRKRQEYSLERKPSEPKYWPGHFFAGPLAGQFLKALCLGALHP